MQGLGGCWRRLVRGRPRVVLLAVIVAAALTLPASAQATIVAYSGQTSPQDFSNDGIDNGAPERFGFNFDGSSIFNVVTYTSLRCPDGEFMNMGVVVDKPGEPFPVVGGHFDATIGDPNDGFG